MRKKRRVVSVEKRSVARKPKRKTYEYKWTNRDGLIGSRKVLCTSKLEFMLWINYLNKTSHGWTFWYDT